MVATQLEGRGIHDPLVLRALGSVPRHLFVPEEFREHAYEDRALPLARGQTISQPYIVAAMTQALNPARGDRVLEVGTGSGYQTAVLAWLGAHVVTIERVPELSAKARETLEALHLAEHVEFVVGDGSVGPPNAVPESYAGVVVTAAAPQIPQSLLRLVTLGGRLVVPVGETPERQMLLRIEKLHGGRTRETKICECSFVPLLGQEGWHGRIEPAG